jgi:hypothetical protein
VTAAKKDTCDSEKPHGLRNFTLFRFLIVSGMAARPSAPLYYVAAEIPHASDPTLHMTIALVREPQARSMEFGVALENLARMITPLQLSLGALTMFGADKDVPVRLVSFENAMAKASLDSFVATWHNPPEDNPGGRTQVYHITVKNLSQEEAASLQQLTAPTLFLGIAGRKGFKAWTSAPASLVSV